MSEDRLTRARRLAAEAHPSGKATLKRVGFVTFGMPRNLALPETQWPTEAFDAREDGTIVADLRRSWRV